MGKTTRDWLRLPDGGQTKSVERFKAEWYRLAAPVEDITENIRMTAFDPGMRFAFLRDRHPWEEQDGKKVMYGVSMSLDMPILHILRIYNDYTKYVAECIERDDLPDTFPAWLDAARELYDNRHGVILNA